MRRAEADRGLEIIAHAHAEIGKPAFLRERLEQREMHRGGFIGGGNTHQPRHHEPQFHAAMLHKGDRVLWRDAGLLGFFAAIHFEEKLRGFSGLLDFALERLGELQPVKRLDAVEQTKSLAHLIGLQRPDQMQLHARKPRAQLGPFGACLLDAIFAEDAVTGLEHRQNAFGPMAFAHGNQTRFSRRSDRGRSRGGDTGENSLEILGRIDGYEGVLGGQIMASALARAKLARAARQLNACSPHLPPLILMTDEQRLNDPLAVALALPKNCAIILRHTDAKARAGLAESLRKIAHKNGLLLLIAGDAALAARLTCDGLHLPEARAREAAHFKALHPDWLITAAAHSARAVTIAAGARCDAVLLAPVFATQSHIGRAGLGVSRFCAIAQNARLPIYALGGVNAQNSHRLAGARLAGIAALDALIPTHNS
jgi:thiamine-phosphate pyrophosphorylase